MERWRKAFLHRPSAACHRRRVAALKRNDWGSFILSFPSSLVPFPLSVLFRAFITMGSPVGKLFGHDSS